MIIVLIYSNDIYYLKVILIKWLNIPVYVAQTQIAHMKLHPPGFVVMPYNGQFFPWFFTFHNLCKVNKSGGISNEN